MRIAIFTPFIYPFHIDMASTLSKLVNVYVFTCGTFGNYPFDEFLAKKYVVKLNCVNIISSDRIMVPWEALKFLKYRPHISIIFGSESLAGILLYFLSRLIRAKTIVIVEENYVTTMKGLLKKILQSMKRTLVKITYKSADILVAESHASKKYVLKVLHVKRTKPLIVMVHGVDTKKFSKRLSISRDVAKRIVVEKLNMPNDNLVKKRWCTFIGEPSYAKGITILLDAIELISKHGSITPNECVFLIPKLKILRDRKDLRPIYQRKLSQLHITGYIVMYPLLEHNLMPLLYRASDIVVIPSVLIKNGSSDRSPNVALEALASGCIIIASYVGGIPTIVGDAAILVKPNDPYALAIKLCQVLSDYEKYKYLEEKARKRAINELDIRLYSYALLELLARLY